ncbi:MAG: DUF429 domain-containing protein [Candidatus Acidiferrales bacterium]
MNRSVWGTPLWCRCKDWSFGHRIASGGHFEFQPEVCFWALNQTRPMKHNKKTKEGTEERVVLLR